jgi:endonuclease YncB( thermonuclease family)
MLRRRFLPPCVAAVTILLAVPALADFTGKVVAVADGDTITVLNGTEQVKVRLDGIDCPETGQPWDTKAKQFTADACFGKTVTIRENDTDRYGRTIDVVMIDGRNLNLSIVQAGYGWWHREYAPKNHELAERPGKLDSASGEMRTPFPRGIGGRDSVIHLL